MERIKGGRKGVKRERRDKKRDGDRYQRAVGESKREEEMKGDITKERGR